MNCELNNCKMCPRECGADRYSGRGICGEGAEMRISKIMLHRFEEPCISGNQSYSTSNENDARGSGAIFFSGCPLHCIYCQNNKISSGGKGDLFSPRQLADEMLHLQEIGAYNINLVSPTHFTYQIIEALDIAKPKLEIPVVFNTGGYEKAETVKRLEGYADIFLTDFKYGSSETASKYSAAPNYVEVAARSLKVMLEITGTPVFDENGMMKKGVILRHLVLPGCRQDSVKALQTVANTVPSQSILLSLMSQYTPEFAPENIKELRRRITSFEYNFVLSEAEKLGFDGFSQAPSSATSAYTPEF